MSVVLTYVRWFHIGCVLNVDEVNIHNKNTHVDQMEAKSDHMMYPGILLPLKSNNFLEGLTQEQINFFRLGAEGDKANIRVSVLILTSF